MDIDERIQALTMNLELLSRDRESDIADSKRRWAENDRFLRDLMEGTARLLHTAEMHEHRISELEEGGEA